MVSVGLRHGGVRYSGCGGCGSHDQVEDETALSPRTPDAMFRGLPALVPCNIAAVWLE